MSVPNIASAGYTDMFLEVFVSVKMWVPKLDKQIPCTLFLATICISHGFLIPPYLLVDYEKVRSKGELGSTTFRPERQTTVLRNAAEFSTHQDEKRNLFRFSLANSKMSFESSMQNVQLSKHDLEAFNPQKFGSTVEQRRRASIPTSKACGIKLVLAGKVSTD